MAFLELVKGSSAGSRFELDGDRSIIGRSADCEVPIDVPAVSRRHAAILCERGRYFIEDLQSRNGTFLKDKRLTDRTPLDEGDLFIICDQEFRFHSGVGTGVLDPRRADENGAQRLVFPGDVEVGLERRDLSPEGVPPYAHVDEAKVLAVEHDHPGARAEDRARERADRVVEAVQVHKPRECRRLAARDHEAVEH